MLQHALEAEHLVAVLAEEVDLVVLVGLAILHHWAFGGFCRFFLSSTCLNRKHCKNRVIYWQSVRGVLVHSFVKRAFYLIMLADFSSALIAKSVSARVRKRLLFFVIVSLVADLAVKD
jgi:hypothetical protein